MLCDVCEEREAEIDAVLEGDFKRLCKQCAVFEGATVISKPTNVNIEASFKRANSRDVLMRMGGLNRPRLAKKEVHLDDLRRIQNELVAEQKKFSEDMKHIGEPEKRPWSKWIRDPSEKKNMKEELSAKEILDL